MRRRLEAFIPIVLLAIVVQLFAPVAAFRVVAVTDPLQAAVICHDDAGSTQGQNDPTGKPHAHDGCCSLCSVAHSGAPLDMREIAVAMPYRRPVGVVWLDPAPNLLGARTGSHAQARAPPQLT